MVSRIRITASEAWSSPNTDSTPRICANWPGTPTKGLVSSGLRKNWSIARSASPKAIRSSSTTLPIVWWSLTRRYRSSIQCSSGSGSAPMRTWSSRSAKRLARCDMCSSALSNSSKAACKYNTEVATSMASAGGGGSPERRVPSITLLRAWAKASLLGWSLRSESQTKLNWSAAGLSLLRSPPAKEDQVSVAVAMRLRACVSTAGSKRPKRRVS